jgi:hypothetical protein
MPGALFWFLCLLVFLSQRGQSINSRPVLYRFNDALGVQPIQLSFKSFQVCPLTKFLWMVFGHLINFPCLELIHCIVPAPIPVDRVSVELSGAAYAVEVEREPRNVAGRRDATFVNAHEIDFAVCGLKMANRFSNSGLVGLEYFMEYRVFHFLFLYCACTSGKVLQHKPRRSGARSNLQPVQHELEETARTGP